MAEINKIREAMAAARLDWVDYTIEQEHKIYVLFSEAANSITADIAKTVRAGKIPQARMTYLLDQIKREMDFLRPKLKNYIVRGRSKSIDYGLKTSIIGATAGIPSNLKAGIGTSFINKAGKVIRYDSKIETYATSTWATINGNAMDALMRTNYGGITLSRRVWDVTWPVEKQIRNQINLAVLTGSGAETLSRKMRSYLGLPDTFKGIAFKDFHPGSGVYKSAYKNALRLSGTEINRAYNEGIIRYMKEKTWITGGILRTGSGNPCEDCTDLEGIFFLKDDPIDIPVHPHCYCWTEIQYEEE